MRPNLTRLIALPVTVAAAMGLAGCTAATPEAAPAPSREAPVNEAPTPDTARQANATPGGSRPLHGSPPGGRPHPSNSACENVTRYDIYKVDGGDWTWAITGDRTDTGSAVHATGTPNADLTEYVVAPGDLISAIGARFCIDSVHLGLINHRDAGEIYADETISLFPDGAAESYVIDPGNEEPG